MIFLLYTDLFMKRSITMESLNCWRFSVPLLTDLHYRLKRNIKLSCSKLCCLCIRWRAYLFIIRSWRIALCNFSRKIQVWRSLLSSENFLKTIKYFLWFNQNDFSEVSWNSGQRLTVLKKLCSSMSWKKFSMLLNRLNFKKSWFHSSLKSLNA